MCKSPVLCSVMPRLYMQVEKSTGNHVLEITKLKFKSFFKTNLEPLLKVNKMVEAMKTGVPVSVVLKYKSTFDLKP